MDERQRVNWHMSPRRWSLIATCGFLLFAPGQAAFAQVPDETHFSFVGVGLGSKTRQADLRLVDYLNKEAHVAVVTGESKPYETVLYGLVNGSGSSPYLLARVTPYVYIVAEMLGAEFDTLATYRRRPQPLKGAKQGTAPIKSTYYAYFVVSRRKFTVQPSLDDLYKFLQNNSELNKQTEGRSPLASFIYHDEYSTSSYFLPSLFFSSRRIYATTEPEEGITAIKSYKPDEVDRSSQLIAKVAADDSGLTLAAVWDANVEEADRASAADIPKPDSTAEDLAKVWLIQLPQPLPDDLLVCSPSVPEEARKRLRNALAKMPERAIGIGDFDSWETFENAREAREAIAVLRFLARDRPTPVTVGITTPEPMQSDSLVTEAHIRALKRAIRLSGTEFIPFEKDYHRLPPDVDWAVRLSHDSTVNITSSVHGAPRELQQNLPITFNGLQDLTTKVAQAILWRLHRIRYIWPYTHSQAQWTILHDVDFPIDKDSKVFLQKIVWIDPEKNRYHDFPFVRAAVAASDPAKVEIGRPVEPPQNFNPLSNVSYRAILVRPDRPSPPFVILVYAMEGILGLAGGMAVFELARRKKAFASDRRRDVISLAPRYQERQQAIHQLWKTRKVFDSDLVWCDRKAIETLISDLKASGHYLALDESVVVKRGAGLMFGLPLPKGLGALRVERERYRELRFSADQVSDPVRVSRLINFLADKDELSSFVGEVIEWEVMEAAVSETILKVGTVAGDGLLRRQSHLLQAVVGKHFSSVIEDAQGRVSLIRRTWEVEHRASGCALTSVERASGAPLLLNGEDEISVLRLEASVLNGANSTEDLSVDSLEAWLLGVVHQISKESQKDGEMHLVMRFRPMALVRV